MATYNSKNYEVQGGDEWVIGGKLTFEGNGVFENGPVATQADSTATTIAGLVTDFNALLAKLKAAGVMKNA